MRVNRSLAVFAVLLAACGGGKSGSNLERADAVQPAFDENMLPIVFVHGVAGSAQQYQSQKMRFVANGYPPERIKAFEYDGGVNGIATAAAGGMTLDLMNFIDEVRAEFDVEQVYLVGHSLGTIVSTHYLLSGFVTGPIPATLGPADRVAKYIGIDGATGPCPGGVPCTGVFAGESSTGLGDEWAELENQAHVEVATSAESFLAQFEFLIERPPLVVEITPASGPIQVAGRAVDFPANTGRAGSSLQVWPVDAGTGHRISSEPVAHGEIGEDGAWGPFELQPTQHYEFVLLTPGMLDHHFYAQPFLRGTDFARLLSGPDDSDTGTNTHRSDNHSALVVSRMREWYAEHPSGANDVLQFSTVSVSREDQPAFDVLAADTTNDTIGLHIHDAESSPGDTTGEPLPYFPDQAFQTGFDVFMPATSPPDGTITVTNLPRGDSARPQTINVPNWPSSGHRISLSFNDYVAR